jgi:signal transduction histidine kinase
MIVENIISNAIKYSYEGGTVSINIATKGRKLIFSVTDQGVGIREKDIPLLFQKFTRIDNELSRRVGGSGIGLYLAQELAKAHGGEITVDTTARKGATFTLTIPGVVQQRSKKRAIKKSE